MAARAFFHRTDFHGYAVQYFSFMAKTAVHIHVFTDRGKNPVFIPGLMFIEKFLPHGANRPQKGEKTYKDKQEVYPRRNRIFGHNYLLLNIGTLFAF
jgi:hypothetical protein